MSPIYHECSEPSLRGEVLIFSILWSPVAVVTTERGQERRKMHVMFSPLYIPGGRMMVIDNGNIHAFCGVLQEEVLIMQLLMLSFIFSYLFRCEVTFFLIRRL